MSEQSTPSHRTQAEAAEAAPLADREVDARGHRCPMPLLMAKRALNTVDVGQTVFLMSTDAGSQRDFEVFAQQSGHELIDSRESGDEFHFTLRKR